MAMCGMKSITMCQEIVVTLFLPWSLVETSTTGPDSRKVNPFRLSISLNGILSLHLFSPAHRNRRFVCEIQISALGTDDLVRDGASCTCIINSIVVQLMAVRAFNKHVFLSCI